MIRSSFLRRQDGAAAVEFALVSLIFVSMMLGVIDMARYAWEINSAKAAARAGARLAIVIPPVVSQLVNFDAVTSCTLGGGSAIPQTCNPGSTDYSCTSSACTAGGTLVSANFTPIVTQMQQYYGRLQASNVRVQYSQRGLGVAGNPMGSDIEPLVTVSITGLTFQPIALQVFGVTLPIPTVETTLVGEDMTL